MTAITTNGESVSIIDIVAPRSVEVHKRALFKSDVIGSCYDCNCEIKEGEPKQTIGTTKADESGFGKPILRCAKCVLKK
tara:strand:- start:7858 stop:8094 length:237 start_codon:yes stop_codon:yes gene_type:complete